MQSIRSKVAFLLAMAIDIMLFLIIVGANDLGKIFVTKITSFTRIYQG